MLAKIYDGLEIEQDCPKRLETSMVTITRDSAVH